jgi:hypothetical protein
MATNDKLSMIETIEKGELLTHVDVTMSFPYPDATPPKQAVARGSVRIVGLRKPRLRSLRTPGVVKLKLDLTVDNYDHARMLAARLFLGKEIIPVFGEDLVDHGGCFL